MNKPPIILVHLRRPRRGDRRSDPFYEYGSFGLTGCHRKNLLADDAAAGARLAFAQGGKQGFRIVMIASAERDTLMQQFSSSFRSRKKALPEDVARDVVTAWEAATQDATTQATAYWESLPSWEDDVVDRDRDASYREWERHASGERPRPRRCAPCAPSDC